MINIINYGTVSSPAFDVFSTTSDLNASVTRTNGVYCWEVMLYRGEESLHHGAFFETARDAYRWAQFTVRFGIEGVL